MTSFTEDAARMIADEASRELLKVEDAARRLSVSRSVLYRLMDSGDIRWVKVGRSRRVVKASLYEYVARKSADAQG